MVGEVITQSANASKGKQVAHDTDPVDKSNTDKPPQKTLIATTGDGILSAAK